MKKTFVCLLSIIMIFSTLLPLGASAASGTPISTADEFMAMKSGGEYYLAADITLNTTYEQPFEGTLNGNGKSVTVSAPIFADFSGKVENLTINGEIKATDKDASAFALTSSKGFEAVNCTNNAPVTVMGNAKYASGFVGLCYNAAVKFTNCVNNGDIYLDSTADEKPRAGGFGAIIDTLVMNGCVNNGSIYLKGNNAIAGGLVARVAQNKGENYLDVRNSVNNGNVLVEDTYIAADGTPGTGASDAGGIVGHIGIKDNIATYQIWGCTNNGDINGQYRTGGLVGYCYASGSSAFIDMQFCINTGDVTYGRTQLKPGTSIIDFGSTLIGYTNSSWTTLKYCIDTGNITKRKDSVSSYDFTMFIGCSSADITQYDIQAVYLLNKDQYEYLTYSDPFSSVVNTTLFGQFENVIHTSVEDIASGKVAYEINLAAANEKYSSSAFEEGFAFYQKIGEDSLPSTDPSRGWIVLSGDTYANGERAEETQPPETTKSCQDDTLPVTTKASETTASPSATASPETEAPEQTGCGGFSCYAFLMLIICASCLVKKRSD